MIDLSDRVVLVTGAARGVGAEIARRFHTAGATVIAADIRDDDGARVVTDLEHASYRSLDVTDEHAWADAVAAIVAEHDRLDVLVNNAAILHIGTLANTDPDTFRRVVDVNTVGPLLGMRAVVPHMKAAGRGSIVQIGSIDGLTSMNGISAYSASKFGLRGLTKSAALELGRDGIRVNCICNGGGNPEMYEPWMDAITPHLDEMMAYQNDRALPGPVPFTAIADAAVFLASDMAAGITGIDLPVDNGAMAGTWLAGFNTL